MQAQGASVHLHVMFTHEKGINAGFKNTKLQYDNSLSNVNFRPKCFMSDGLLICSYVMMNGTTIMVEQERWRVYMVKNSNFSIIRIAAVYFSC